MPFVAPPPRLTVTDRDIYTNGAIFSYPIYVKNTRTTKSAWARPNSLGLSKYYRDYDKANASGPFVASLDVYNRMAFRVNRPVFEVGKKVFKEGGNITLNIPSFERAIEKNSWIPVERYVHDQATQINTKLRNEERGLFWGIENAYSVLERIWIFKKFGFNFFLDLMNEKLII